MSLVNDMLRDLEKRKRTPGSNSERVGGVMGVNLDEETRAPWLLMVMVLAGVALGVGGAYWYFQTNSTVKQTPVAVVEAVPASSASNTMPELADTINTTVDAGDQEQATEQIAEKVTARLIQESISAGGFEISFSVPQRVPFEVISRSSNGINVYLPDVAGFNNASVSIDGLNLSSNETGSNILIELAQEAEFKVYEGASNGEFVFIIEAGWEQVSNTVLANPVQPLQSTQADVVAAPAPPPARTVPRQPVRTGRVLSLEAQDKNASLAAAKLMQQGQISAAYAGLMEFIELHPEMHQSRQTLATLLLAQEDYSQAEQVINEGLLLAPNYSGYKKIKARILMHNDRAADAIGLLENVPPRIAKDVEYYELLGSLYQQLGRHQKAIETYQELLRHDRLQGKYWTGMAVSLEARGNISDAIASFQAGMQDTNLDASLRTYSSNRIDILGRQL